MSKRIKFYIRVIPDERTGPESFEIDDDQKVIWFYNVRCPAMSKLPYIKFETDGIFTDACQAFIYDTVLGQDVASYVSKGEDLIVLVCGPNGTGKTYTMTGIRDHYHFRGIIPRLFETLFELKQKKDFTMRVAALEFINGTCYDLLSNPVQDVDCRKLKGEKLKSEQEALELLFKVESRRKSVSNENCGSLVLTVFIKPLQRSQKTPIIQKIHLVDTAGSEVHWAKMLERPCLQRKTNRVSTFVYDPSSDWAFSAEKAVKGRLQPHNAFRNCQMVGYLCHSLRHGSIRLIGHVRRCWDSQRYTLATLRFGSRLTGRVEELSSREVVGPSSMTINQSLEREVQRLRDELALTDLLENGVVPVTVPQVNTSRLNVEVENYLKSPETVSCAHLMTIAHPFTVLGAFKTVYRRCLDELKEEYDMGDGDVELPVKRKSRAHSKAGKKKSVGSLGLDEIMLSKLAEVAAQSNQPAESKILQDAPKDPNKDKAILITPETLEIAKLNRQNYWKEFLSRHPYWHQKLMAAGEDMKSAREEQHGLDEQLKALNKRLHENKLEVDRTSWERAKDVGNPVDSKGQIMLSEDERNALDKQEALHQEYTNLMKTFKLAHYHYIEVAYKFNEAHEAANKLFTEYLATTYWNVLALPAGEDYEETMPILGVDLSKKPTVTKSEEIFLELQNKHLNRVSRTDGIPHISVGHNPLRSFATFLLLAMVREHEELALKLGESTA